jgi:hypothetical protein
VEAAIMVIMAIVAVVACVRTVVALMCAAVRDTLRCAALRGTLMCAALRGTLMRTAARESCLAFRTEAVPVSCKARLGSPDIRYRVTAEPEGIMSAGIADCLGRRRAQIPGHAIGQQSEHHDCREPYASLLNIFHLARSLCDPPRLTARPHARGEGSRGGFIAQKCVRRSWDRRPRRSRHPPYLPRSRSAQRILPVRRAQLPRFPRRDFQAACVSQAD